MVRRQRKLSTRKAKKKSHYLGLSSEALQLHNLQEERHSAQNSGCHAGYDELKGLLKEDRLL